MNAKMKKTRLAWLSNTLAAIIFWSVLLPVVILLVGYMLGFFAPPPGHHSPLFNPTFVLIAKIIWFAVFATLILSPAALITGIMALIQNTNYENNKKDRELAWGGIIVGTICLVIWSVIIYPQLGP